MDDEERLISCKREIFRLRRVVRCMEADVRQYEKELREEIEKRDMEQSGLKRALEIWHKIQNEE